MGYLSARGTPFSASAVPIFKIARRKGVSINLGFVRSISVRDSISWDLVGRPVRQRIAGQN
jgi:hypothetical protein